MLGWMPRGCRAHQRAWRRELLHHQEAEEGEEHHLQMHRVEVEVEVVLQVLSIPVLVEEVALMGHVPGVEVEVGGHRVRRSLGVGVEGVEEDSEKLWAGSEEAQLGLEVAVEEQQEGMRVRHVQVGPLVLEEVEAGEKSGLW